VNQLDLTTRPSERGCVLAMAGELDFHTSPQAHQVLRDLPLQPGQQLVLDLGGLTFCDSSGLTVLVAAHNRTQSLRASLALAAVSDNLARILRIVGLDQILTTYETAEAAVRG
jgi:anti-sigma B factor antagonist